MTLPLSTFASPAAPASTPSQSRSERSGDQPPQGLFGALINEKPADEAPAKTGSEESQKSDDGQTLMLRLANRFSSARTPDSQEETAKSSKDTEDDGNDEPVEESAPSDPPGSELMTESAMAGAAALAGIRPTEAAETKAQEGRRVPARSATADTARGIGNVLAEEVAVDGTGERSKGALEAALIVGEAAGLNKGRTVSTGNAQAHQSSMPPRLAQEASATRQTTVGRPADADIQGAERSAKPETDMMRSIDGERFTNRQSNNGETTAISRPENSNVSPMPIMASRNVSVPLTSAASAALDHAASTLTQTLGDHLNISQIQEFNGGKTKVLKLQLQPAHLGQLDIVLKGENGRLTVQIQTESANAQNLLTQEKASLRTALDEANLVVETLSIESVKDRRIAPTSLAQADSQMNTQGQTTGERFDGNRSSGQMDGERSRHPFQPFTSDDPEQAPARDGRSGDRTRSGGSGLRI
ncbi:flagellar hook-length control protein FliK [Notoacmeibacter ruber]|uniref:Flagellar hook-length control protein FliK n=1 Tax=Notoacmeibacter ruber TaxID=2670375 RepID=A0A3L7JDJ6_9HYPH|nr:flagellar hook-length control protein FliK [Notoacmeibacter ruber]RLQ88837.1 flagellar hook-length control protein FliK [Notoacmeibacter ruber]